MPRTNLRDSVSPDMLKSGTRAKIIARNTFRFTAPDGAVVTRLHQTDVVRELSPGRYQLNSGGWRTPTTKDRINGTLRGYVLFADKGTWYVRRGSHPYADWAARHVDSIPYFDDMILPDAFDKPAARKRAEKNEQGELALRKQILAFVRLVDRVDQLPLPDTGDCWLCALHDASGKTMGEHGDDRDHLLNHIREKYLHGSLLVNAMRWAGYQDVGIRYWLSRPKGHRRSVKSALRRYLCRKLGLSA